MSEVEGTPGNAAEDSEATASDTSRHAAHAKHASPLSTASDEPRQGPRETRGQPERPDQLGRNGGHDATANASAPGRAAASDDVRSGAGVLTPSLSAPLPGPAMATPSTASGQLAAGEAALHHVLSGHSAATFLDASGSPRFQGSSGSASLSGRDSLLSSLLAARHASAPIGGVRRPQASAAQQVLASLLGALRQHQRAPEGVPGAPAAAPAQPAAAAAAQPGGVARQLSNTSSVQALLSSVGFKLRTHDQGESTRAEPKQLLQLPSSAQGKETVADSTEASGRQSSRGLQRTNSLPIPDPELRRILTGDLSALAPTRSHPVETPSVAFQLGHPIPNPFAGFANELHRQASSLASHPPLHWSAAALAATAQPPPAGPAPQASAATSDTASRRSGDAQREASAGQGAISSKRKAAAVAGGDASAEQSAESLPRPNLTSVRRALADVLDWSASSKPSLGRQWSAALPAPSAPATAADLQRHAGDFLRQMQESMRSAQSLPPRSSLTADSYRALEHSIDAAGQASAWNTFKAASAHICTGSARAIAEEVQRLLGRARSQRAAAAAGATARADESDAGADDSEAAREGEPAADSLEERIKRRRLSNRESARRTRQRRNNELAELRATNEALAADAKKLRAQVAELAAANHALLASIPGLGDHNQQTLSAENAALKAELLELRAAVTQHLQAHASQLPYAQSIALSQVIEQARRQANAEENEEGGQQ